MNDFDGFTKKWWDRKCGISGICVSLIMLALEIKSSSNARLRSHIIQSTESDSITVPRCIYIEPVLVGRGSRLTIPLAWMRSSIYQPCPDFYVVAVSNLNLLQKHELEAQSQSEVGRTYWCRYPYPTAPWSSRGRDASDHCLSSPFLYLA